MLIMKPNNLHSKPENLLPKSAGELSKLAELPPQPAKLLSKAFKVL